MAASCGGSHCTTNTQFLHCVGMCCTTCTDKPGTSVHLCSGHCQNLVTEHHCQCRQCHGTERTV